VCHQFEGKLARSLQVKEIDEHAHEIMLRKKKPLAIALEHNASSR
jgi:hypothetical protein